MAVLPIKRFPDPVLRQKAKRVREIDKWLQKLIEDMFETLNHVHGVGLAAPQVGISLRLSVIKLPEEKEKIILINPVIIKRKGARLVEEGCLSIPGYKGELTRSEEITVKGWDGEGKALRIKGEGLLAQALEHEIDHLNGTLYIDRLESPEKLTRLEPEEEGKESKEGSLAPEDIKEPVKV